MTSMLEPSIGNTPICKKIKTASLLALITLTGITCINLPPCTSWENFGLQHIGTLLLVIPLLYDSIKNRMPMSAFVGLILFALLHVIGARWIYSYVPYREWSISLGVPADFWGVPADFHGDPGTFFKECVENGKMEFRNHYDRLIHLSFGLLMFPFLLYKTRKWVDRNSMVAILVAWLLVQAGSMIYEILEWQLSVWSKGGDAYNGQQGDMWDAQKDMALAMLGSTIMVLFYVIKDRCINPHHTKGETK